MHGLKWPIHSARIVQGLGVWWSRHWGNPHNIPWGGGYFGPMTEDNVMTKVVEPYEAKGLPLHVLVMVRIHIIGHARISIAGKSQSCMVSTSGHGVA